MALLVCGGIAAYKSCEVLRGLQKAGCEVRVAMTDAATKFVGPATFRALTGREIILDLFSCAETPIAHVELAEWSDLVLVCPATANVMGKVANGIADDAVSSTMLACGGKAVMVPAMNVHMWRNAAVQANARTLRSRGIEVLEPAHGRLACGDVGEGKLPEVSDIVAAALSRLTTERDLEGRRVVITAGPTHEPIDPVRYLSNASSGKMGYALAAACAAHGAAVTLVSGPVAIAAPASVDVVRVTTAAQMLDATCEAFDEADAAILAAAVSDYRPAHAANHKLKKGMEPLERIELVENEDILATLSASRGNRVVIGFAAETDDVIEHARAKLARKGCDLIVANDVSRADSTFGSETDRVAFVGTDGVEHLETMSKARIADAIATRLSAMLGVNGRACLSDKASSEEAASC